MAAIIFGFIAVGAADFLLFARRAATMAPDPEAQADGVVALTGGSVLRISAGVQLVTEGRGRRLLISGVNPEVKREDLVALAGGDTPVWDCCVDLGYVAETTIGNADETAAWAYENEYTSLIVVTSDYHMARSLLVLHEAMPDIELVPWPVRTAVAPDQIWSHPKSLKGVFTEWAKWRVTTFG